MGGYARHRPAALAHSVPRSILLFDGGAAAPRAPARVDGWVGRRAERRLAHRDLRIRSVYGKSMRGSIASATTAYSISLRRRTRRRTRRRGKRRSETTRRQGRPQGRWKRPFRTSDPAIPSSNLPPWRPRAMRRILTSWLPTFLLWVRSTTSLLDVTRLSCITYSSSRPCDTVRVVRSMTRPPSPEK